MKLPKFEDLTKEQKDSVEISTNFSVSGGAGTGKTMVAIWRHIQNLQREQSSYLITFTHTLTYFLEILVSQEVATNETINNANNFIKNISEIPNLEELIIDEAQDLNLEQHNILKAKFPNISFGVDNKQTLYHHSTNQKILEDLYQPKYSQKLQLNFRNSYLILELAQAIFPKYEITQKMIDYSKYKYNIGRLPHLIIHKRTNFVKYFCDLLKSISSDRTIAILVPTLEIMEYYRGILEICLGYENYTSYNYKDFGNIRQIGIKRIHLTTFHSSKGLEFDAVIIPEFQLFSESNQYYVGITRAKTELYLFSENINPLENIDPTLLKVQNV